MKAEPVFYADTPIQMALPVFQPLRLWNARSDLQNKRDTLKSQALLPVRAFSMKGGFVSMPGGERRLVIAGKIFSRS
ncbi:MAG: hypothetical protein GX556_01895 [Fibrobacter sp.]|nr:hypothetical protein [Fibrobacter sp.]